MVMGETQHEFRKYIFNIKNNKIKNNEFKKLPKYEIKNGSRKKHFSGYLTL